MTLTDRSPLAGMELRPAKLTHPVWAEVAPTADQGGFVAGEFRAPEQMAVEFLRLLHRVRVRAGVPFRIVSDARDPADGIGVPGSAHDERPCCCVDVRAQSSRERSRIVRAAVLEGFVRIGVYPPTDGQKWQWGINSGSVHLDASVDLPQDVMWVGY